MIKFFERIADYIRETDKILILLCSSASLFGAIMVLSATYISSGAQKFAVQLIGFSLGLFVAILISMIDYQSFIKKWYFFAAFGLLLVLLTFQFGFAPEGTDDKAWLRLPFGQTIQPSELLKIAFIISFTKHVSSIKPERISDFKNVLLLCIHGIIPVGLIHLQGDDGSAMVLLFIFLGMLFAAGVKAVYFAAAGGLVAAALPVLWFFIMNNDQKNRILALFNPENFSDIIFQQYRGQTAVGSGGLFGYGLFNGPYVQDGKIPLGFNDFIFASIGEELGFIGCLLAMGLITAICFRILKVAGNSRDRAGKIICTGVFAMFASQFIINIGMVLSILPVIGVTLPFFSAGGTSTVCLYLGIGLVLSVYCHRNIKPIVLGE